MSINVTVVGAAGGIGQPLSLSLKQSGRVAELRLYDVSPLAKGVAAEISHLPTKAKVSAFVGGFSDPAIQKEQLSMALDGTDVVVISAGFPRKPGMTRQDLFDINASIMHSIIEVVAEVSPNAFVAIISNPVNSLVPLAAHVLELHGAYNPRKLCGITQLDILRARTFVADHYGANISQVDVPVVGGHAGTTIVPLFSQCTVPVEQADRDQLTERIRESATEDREALTKRVQNAGTEVVQAKEGKGSATLSMAVAAYMFVEEVMKGLTGEGIGRGCAYVDTGGLSFFADMCSFDGKGVFRGAPTPRSESEERAVQAMLPDLAASHQAAKAYLANPPPPKPPPPPPAPKELELEAANKTIQELHVEASKVPQLEQRVVEMTDQVAQLHEQLASAQAKVDGAMAALQG